jgi:hypothetical protein
MYLYLSQLAASLRFRRHPPRGCRCRFEVTSHVWQAPNAHRRVRKTAPCVCVWYIVVCANVFSAYTPIESSPHVPLDLRCKRLPARVLLALADVKVVGALEHGGHVGKTAVAHHVLHLREVRLEVLDVLLVEHHTESSHASHHPELATTDASERPKRYKAIRPTLGVSVCCGGWQRLEAQLERRRRGPRCPWSDEKRARAGGEAVATSVRLPRLLLHVLTTATGH